jgi:hypothetical protein
MPKYVLDRQILHGYARGLPITMLPYGVLAPASFVTLDWRSAWTQLEHYAQLVMWNWRRKPPEERGLQQESDS